MSAPTPEKLAELRRLLDTPPQHITIARDDALALLDAAAERGRLAEAVRAYGRTIDRWGLLIIAATHSEDITTPDGDGDWEVIESRLAEVPALLAERDALAAKLDAVRALHIAHDCTSHAGIATICAHRPGICLACLKPLPCPTIRAIDTIPGWARAQAEAIRADELRRHEAGLDADLAYQAFAGEEALR